MSYPNFSCYSFQQIIKPKGFLDESVDATYIIYLEGNGRLPRILKELEKCVPTKIIYILSNKGFRKCYKQLRHQITVYDLIDANLNIMKHANQQNYKNILILEDDFIWDEKCKDPKVIDQVNSFIH
jgi:transcriptional regulator of met regulon